MPGTGVLPAVAAEGAGVCMAACTSVHTLPHALFGAGGGARREDGGGTAAGQGSGAGQRLGGASRQR